MHLLNGIYLQKKKTNLAKKKLYLYKLILLSLMKKVAIWQAAFLDGKLLYFDLNFIVVCY